MTDKNKINVLYLGELGFPNGFAAVQRAILLCKSLLQEGMNVTVICRKGIFNKDQYPGLKSKGVYEGINYINSSGTPYKPGNFCKRNWLKIKGIIFEILYLYKFKKRNFSSAILSTRDVNLLLYYWILSKVFGFSLIVNFVELNSVISRRTSLFNRINDLLYEKFVFLLVDGFLPISDFLINRIEKMSPGKPYLKIPVLCDFNKFKNKKKNNSDKYLLFCGTAAYLEIIVFILKAFDLFENTEKVNLYLIINGKPDQVSKLKKEIDILKKKNFIRVFSNLSYSQLINFYTNALGLLIPLRPNDQDKARFPHKIGEYLASGNPMITNNFGEINNYFVDNETAFIANSYSISEYANKLDFVLLNPQKAKEVGQKGREIGLQNFDYRIYGSKIKSFILTLDHKSE